MKYRIDNNINDGLLRKVAEMITLNEFIEEQLQDPAFKRKYDELELEFIEIQTMIDSGEEKNDIKGCTATSD